MEKSNELSDKEQLFRLLNFIAPLSGGLAERFSAAIIHRHFPKKHVLLTEGDISKQIFFICRGSARAFYYDSKGRENTTWFMSENDLMISVYSFFRQVPAMENIQLLEDSTLLCLKWEQLQSIYKDFPEYNFHGRVFTEKYYIQAEERAIILRTRDPAERYKTLLIQQPAILQKASLGQIASFLGITLETLSRIRGSNRI